MDEFISKCVKMADLFAKLNDKYALRKILTEDEYYLFIEMFNVYSAFKDSQYQRKGELTNVRNYGCKKS